MGYARPSTRDEGGRDERGDQMGASDRTSAPGNGVLSRRVHDRFPPPGRRVLAIPANDGGMT